MCWLAILTVEIDWLWSNEHPQLFKGILIDGFSKKIKISLLAWLTKFKFITRIVFLITVFNYKLHFTNSKRVYKWWTSVNEHVSCVQCWWWYLYVICITRCNIWIQDDNHQTSCKIAGLRLIQNFWHISREWHCSDETQIHPKSMSRQNVQSVVCEFLLTELRLSYSNFTKIRRQITDFQLSCLEIKKIKFPYYSFFICFIGIFWYGNQSCIIVTICCLFAKSLRKLDWECGIVILLNFLRCEWGQMNNR